MRTLALVFTCFAGLFAFGFLFAGIASLMSLDQNERDELKRRSQQRPSSGYFAGARHYFWLRREVDNLMFSSLLAHWRSRPEARRAIWLGVAFLAAAFIVGQFATLPR